MCFSKKSPWSTHEIPQRCFAVPTRTMNDRRSKSFLHRGKNGTFTVASLMKSFTGSINADYRFIFSYVKIEPYIGIFYVHRRAFTRLFTEPIADRIFETLSGIQWVGKTMSVWHRSGYRKCIINIKEIIPFNFFCRRLKISSTMTVKSKQWGKNSSCKTW